MESTNKTRKNDKLQLFKEQMIQRSKQSETSEESQYYLCLADLYTLALQHESATMFGSTITLEVGGSNDAVQKVSIELRPDFTKRASHFETNFSQWQAVPNNMIQKVPDKRFNTADEAYDFITGLAESINRFFNSIQL